MPNKPGIHVLVFPAEFSEGEGRDEETQKLGRGPGAPEARAAEQGRQPVEAGGEYQEGAHKGQKPRHDAVSEGREEPGAENVEPDEEAG